MADPDPPEELWEQILLRLPPDDPASLARASLVSKQWRRIVSSPGFRDRFRQLHRAPPMLGFFYNYKHVDKGGTTHDGFAFVPTTASASALPIDIPEGRSWRVLDCRHGRLLLVSSRRPQELHVWEPLTGYQRLLPCLPEVSWDWEYGCAAAVMCAADDCDHCNCHGGPFRVVVLYYTHYEEDDDGEKLFTSARVYSSEIAAWGEVTSVGHYRSHVDLKKASILAGNSLYFQCDWGQEIFKYDLHAHTVAVIRTAYWAETIVMMQAEDGGLGVAVVENYPDLQLESWDEGAGWVPGSSPEEEETPGWVPARTIHLEQVLPPAVSESTVAGFAEGVNIIFLNTNDGIYTVELKSCKARKVSSRVNLDSALYPFISFYIPGQQAEGNRARKQAEVENEIV